VRNYSHTMQISSDNIGGSYWIPGSSLIKLSFTGYFYRPSTVVATDGASLEKAISYQALKSCTG
jgi:hypothetical protein